MIQFRQGCKVPFPEKLIEAYTISKNQIIANISADRIAEMMACFITMREEPVFFILELPAKQGDESPNSSGVVQSFHTDVYYIDNCSQSEAMDILKEFGQLLIHDGLCAFGFGGHESQEEMMFGKYNVATVYSHHIADYKPFFADREIPETEHLVTAWDTFSKDHPGVSERVVTNGKDIYSILEDLAQRGLYKAETREA